MLAANGALLFAMQVQQVAKIFSEIPNRIYGKLNAEMCGVRVGNRNVQDAFSAAVQLPDEGFAIKKPRIRELCCVPSVCHLVGSLFQWVGFF